MLPTIIFTVRALLPPCLASLSNHTRAQRRFLVRHASSHKEPRCNDTSPNSYLLPLPCSNRCSPRRHIVVISLTFLLSPSWMMLIWTVCRKPPPQKAWTQGTNPITQRPSNPPTPNGVANTPKPAQHATTPSGEAGQPMRHLSDRMMYLLANLTVSHAMHLTTTGQYG